MPNTSPVFEKHYKSYLEQLASLDFKSIYLKLGGEIINGGKGMSLAFFGTSYKISPEGITGPDKKTPGYDICIILCRYLLMCPEQLPGDRTWVGFRDLKDAGPLTVYFRDNVEQKISKDFSHKLGDLKLAVSSLNGYEPDLEVNYDLALQVDGLPRIPLILLFNDAEPGFASSCSILFQRHVETYLDAECVAMLGSCLAGSLTSFCRKSR